MGLGKTIQLLEFYWIGQKMDLSSNFPTSVCYNWESEIKFAPSLNPKLLSEHRQDLINNSGHGDVIISSYITSPGILLKDKDWSTIVR